MIEILKRIFHIHRYNIPRGHRKDKKEYVMSCRCGKKKYIPLTFKY